VRGRREGGDVVLVAFFEIWTSFTLFGSHYTNLVSLLQNLQTQHTQNVCIVLPTEEKDCAEYVEGVM
jgi:hypothetical protein